MAAVSSLLLWFFLVFHLATSLKVTSPSEGQSFTKGDLMIFLWENPVGNISIQVIDCNNKNGLFNSIGVFNQKARMHMWRNSIEVKEITPVCIHFFSSNASVSISISLEPVNKNLDTSFAGLEVSNKERNDINGLRKIVGQRVDYSSPKARHCLASSDFLEMMSVWNSQTKHKMTISDYEKLFKTNSTGKSQVRHPTSNMCDGPEPTECQTCYNAIDKEIMGRQRALCNSGLCLNRKKIMVVGAGPVGLRMAIDARLAGHAVTLVEERPLFQRHKFFGMFSEEQTFYASIGMPGSMMSEYRIYLQEGHGVTKATMAMRTKQEFLLKIARRIGVEVLFGCSLQHSQIFPKDRKARIHSAKQKSGIDCKLLRFERETIISDHKDIYFDRIIVANGARSQLRNDLLGSQKRPFLELARKELEFITSVDQITEKPTAETAYYNHAFLFNQTAFAKFRNDLLNPDDDVTKKFPRLDAMVFVANADARIFNNNIVFPNSKPMNLGTNSASGSVDRIAYISECFTPDGLSCSKEVDYRWHMELGLPPKLQPENITLEQMRALFRKNKKSESKFLHSLVRETFRLMSKNKIPNENRLQEYLDVENSFPNNVENTASFFHIDGMFATETSKSKAVMGQIMRESNGKIEFYIVGDALQDPWYSFGAGTHDGIRSTPAILRCLSAKVNDSVCQDGLLKHERSMRRRMIQVLFQIYISSQEKIPEEWMTVLRKAFYSALSA